MNSLRMAKRIRYQTAFNAERRRQKIVETRQFVREHINAYVKLEENNLCELERKKKSLLTRNFI